MFDDDRRASSVLLRDIYSQILAFLEGRGVDVSVVDLVCGFPHAVSVNIIIVIFFFQAEDGIRDLIVTGVQTCALPISLPKRALQRFTERKTRQSLEAAFSKLRGQPVRIQRVDGETCVHESSFHAERLRIQFKSGESVPVFFKDLNPQNQIAPVRKVRNNSLSPSYQELRVYKRILSRVNLGTPQLYSVRWEPARRTYWLFLEDIG